MALELQCLVLMLIQLLIYIFSTPAWSNSQPIPPNYIDYMKRNLPVTKKDAFDQKFVIPQIQTRMDLSTLSGSGMDSTSIQEVCNSPYAPSGVGPSGQNIKLLKMAIVYFGSGAGSGMLGHMGERFLFCKGSQFWDVVYEVYPMKDVTLDSVFERANGVSIQSWTEEYKASFQESLYWDVQTEPSKYYRATQDTYNRTVYEAWLNISENVAFKLFLKSAAKYKKQGDDLKNGRPLEKYNLLSSNCTSPIREDVAIINPLTKSGANALGMTPFLAFDSIKSAVPISEIVIYPSQSLFRKVYKTKGPSKIGFWKFSDFEVTTKEGHILSSPLQGLINLAAGGAQTAFGILTLPLDFFTRFSGLDFSFRSQTGTRNIKYGLVGMLDSLPEVFWMRMSFPQSTEWSQEEIQILQSHTQAQLIFQSLTEKN